MSTAPHAPPTARRRLGLLGILAFALCALAGTFLWRHADRDLRTGWLEHARLVQQALPPGLASSLTGTPADVGTPAYEQLKSRLARLRADTPDCRFVYLLGRRPDRTVFFYADSEPAGSKDISVAGDAYPEATAVMHTAFDRNQPGVDGPYNDSFGRWVSALVPVPTPPDSPVTMVLGMDIDARDWNANVIITALPPAFIGLLILLSAGMLLYSLRLRRRNLGDRKNFLQHLFLTLGPIASVAILATFAVQLWARQGVSSRARVHDQLLLLQTADFTRLDQSLTSSALLAALSPDSAWPRLHQSEATRLEDLLASARNLHGVTTGEFIQQLAESSAFLRDAETRALRSAGTGRPDALDSPAYLAAKTRYADTVARLRTAVSEHIEQSLSVEQLNARRNITCLLAAAAIVAGSWLLLHSVLRQRDEAEKRTLELLNENTRRLKAAVESRTADLGASEHRFRTLFETMAQGAVTQDASGAIIEANPAAEKILGLTLDQLKGRTSFDPRWCLRDPNGRVLPGEEHPASVALRTGRPVLGFTAAVFNPALDATRWIIIDSIPQFSSDSLSGGPTHTHTVFTDITDRIVSEQARESQHRALEFIIESDISGYWDWDVAAHTNRWSPALKKMLGYADHELPNHPDTWQRLIHPDDLAPTLAEVKNHFDTRGREPFYIEVRYRHKNGSLVWVICSGGVVDWLPDGSPARMVGCHIDITKAKQAAAQLQATNEQLSLAKTRAERLSLVATRTTNAVVITDARRRITWVNEGFTRISGYTFDEAIGRSPGALLQCASTDPATIAGMRAALAAEKGFRGEVLNRGKNGREYWLDLDIVPLHDDAGTLTGFLGLELDINDRKLAAARLAESSVRTAIALDAGELGLWDWHIPSGETIFDERWASMLGETLADLTPRVEEWSRRCHPEDLLLAQAALQAHFQGETPVYQCLHRMRHRDGRWRWIMDTGKIVSRTADGKPLRMVGTHRDVTEQHQSRIELERQNDALVQTGRLARVGAWEVDPASHRIFWSDEVRNLHEVPADYVPDFESAVAFYPGEAADNISRAVRSALDDGTPFDLELPFFTARGRALWVRVLGEVRRFADGTATLRGAIQDITESHRQRTALAAARDAAEAATRAKSHFLANMSHEIRTPMNGVLGMTHLLLLDSTLNLAQRRQLESIQVSGQALLHIINDILDLSKIEAGRLELDLVDFDLPSFLDEFSAPLRTQAAAKGLRFSCDLSAPLPRRLKGDPHRLRQVLLNLAGNALKFTDAGEISIVVSAADSSSPDRPSLRFTVRDTGPGLTPGELDRLFEKFAQADSSVTRRFGGTGLGLAISKELVALMGGRIGVESRPGQGSTFWFTASFKPADAGPVPAAPAALSSLAALDPRARILLVEDNPINQLVASGILGKFGVKPRVAHHGAEALELLAAEDFDLVLMDIQMPVMDGISATRAIRNSANGVRQPRIPIVAMTAHAIAGDRENALEAGFSDYLTKPINPVSLNATLRRWLAGTPSLPPVVSDAPLPTPASATPSEEPIHLDSLRARMLNDEAMMRRILGGFDASLDEKAGLLRAAVSNANFTDAARTAHTLKGGAANLSALPLRAAVTAIETAALARDPAAAAAGLADLDRAITAFHSACARLAS